jgi:phosphate:Na+ symporter
VIEAKREISALEESALQHLNMRVAVDESDRILLFRLESEMIEYLKRVYYYAKRIAKLIASEHELGAVPCDGNGIAVFSGQEPGIGK